MKKIKGFTIIELLIVMAVIAVLIGIAIPSFRGMQTEAWRTQADGDVRVIKIALESYYKNNGSYPAASGYMGTLRGQPASIIDTALKDPFKTSDDYVYALSSSGSYYVVYSVGVGANGTMTISDTGSAESTAGSPIYTTNGW